MPDLGSIVFAFARRISWWGVASVVLVLGSFTLFHYNFYLHDTGHPALLSTIANYELCVVMQVAAAVCGFIAMRRGSYGWVFAVLVATVQAIGCYFSEV